MSDHPQQPDDPFGDLPPELRRMLEQLGGAEGLAGLQQQMQHLMGGLMGAGPTGPVNWDLATRVALQVAADGDRAPTDDETARAEEALALAEHWLDATSLPAPPDAGRLIVGSRQQWVNAAVTALAPLVEPVARASTDALAELAQEQMGDLDAGALPPEMAGMEGLLSMMGEVDLGEMMRPMGAMLSGLQAGQVIGQLARQLLGQYELGVPTAPRAEAHVLRVNVEEAFAGWELDETEVAVALALHEAAHRRLYHAVPWLQAHIESLVARFASGTRIDPQRLQELSQEALMGVDPDDPEALQEAMQHAAGFQLEPTEEQRRVLDRLQTVTCLVGAWARAEVDRAVGGRLPSLASIDEVLRRRRAEYGDGEQLLAQLLGLDLKPDDEGVGDRFVAAVTAARGPQALRRALDHPENLPSAEELADPEAWLARTEEADGVPDDPSALFDGLGEAPREASAEERRAQREEDADDAGNADDPTGTDGSDGPGDADGGPDDPER